jgi:hypothetical protein
MLPWPSSPIRSSTRRTRGPTADQTIVQYTDREDGPHVVEEEAQDEITGDESFVQQVVDHVASPEVEDPPHQS